MVIQSLYQEFLSYPELERDYSPLTIVAYRSDFRLLSQFLKNL